MEDLTDGKKVQAAIDACYLWRGHVMPHEQVQNFLAAHSLFIEADKIGMKGVYDPGGNPFFIVSAIESPYGLEIDDLGSKIGL
jgi:hypothetical protein